MTFRSSTVLSHEQFAEIRRLHFYTRKLVNQGLAGQYRSAFRGRGIEFEEVREYIAGDDVRSIDWKVTARAKKPFIKVYREERELTVMIAVDVSRSTLTGSHDQMRESLIAKIGAVLTLIALNNNDKVGLVTFSDKIETYHPARKARGAVWRILHEVMSPMEHGSGTNIGHVCQFLSSVLKRTAIVFLISDFVDSEYKTPLAVLAKKHDVTGVVIRDPIDKAIQNVSLVETINPETGVRVLLDTNNCDVRNKYLEASASWWNNTTEIFQRHRVRMLEIQTDLPFVDALHGYFGKRKSERHHHG